MSPNFSRPPLPRIDLNLYLAALQEYAETPYAELDIPGYTHENDPLCRLRITDFSIPDEEKFHLLFAGLHVGGEHAALHGMLCLMEFLLSPAAAEYRKKFVFTFLPVLNPYGCFRMDQDQYHPTGLGIDPYTANHGECFDWKNLTLKDPSAAPELAVFCRTVDEEKPELLFDMHGCNRRYLGQNMRGTIGGGLSNQILWPWSGRILQALRSGAAAGHSAVFDLDEYMERIPAGDSFQQQCPHRFRPSWEHLYTDHYTYLKYHTMPIVWEVGCEETVVDAVRGLLEFARNPPPEWRKGLPVDHVLADFGNLAVSSYGILPGQKRRSRAELWGKLDRLWTRFLCPCYNGQLCAALTVGKAGARELTGERPLNTGADISPAELFAGRMDTETIRWSAIRAFLAATGEGGQRLLPLRHDHFEEMPENEVIENGLTLQSYLPYSGRCNLKVKDVRLNGIPLSSGPLDGYELIRAEDGWHFFVNVPPEKTRCLKLFLVTVEYESDVQLADHWTPSPAISVRAETVAGKERFYSR